MTRALLRWPAAATTPVLFAALLAGSGAAAAAEGEESGYDRVWRRVRLHEGDAEKFFQSFVLSGRLQLDFAYVDSGDDDHGEFNVRRFRFGFKTVFAEDFTFHVEADFDPQDADPFYNRLTDAYLAWSPGRAIKLTLGKHSVGFTLDGMTSSKNERLGTERERHSTQALSRLTTKVPWRPRGPRASLLDVRFWNPAHQSRTGGRA